MGVDRREEEGNAPTLRPSGSDREQVAGLDSTLLTPPRVEGRSAAGEGMPERIGRFRVLSLLGAGGMGKVFAAFDPQLDRKVAIKLIRSEVAGEGAAADRFRQRLLREARAMARLSHPNVVTVFDAGAAGDEIFIAMELVEGTTLRAWVERGPRSWRDVLDMFIQAGRGLQAAHQAGLVHRDFKPDNVLVSADGRARVTDFGLAMAVSAPDSDAGEVVADSPAATDSSLSRSGLRVGTPRYMSPEQHTGSRTDARTDQFSFCVALWEAVHGRPPFAGSTPLELTEAVLAGRLQAPAADVQVPPRLRRILERGLAREPEGRFPAMDALLAELVAVARGRRHGLYAVGGGTLMAAAVVAVVVAALGPEPPGPCSGSDDLVGVHWNADRAATLRAAFAGTGRDHAGVNAERTVDGLDRWRARWADIRTEICLAARQRDDAAQTLEVQSACLDRQLDQLGAVVELFGRADAWLVGRSADAVRALPGPEQCRDVLALRAIAPPPSDPGLRTAIDQVQAMLARVRALESAGGYPAALALASTARASARALGWTPAIIEAEYRLGRLQDHSGMLVEAEATLTDVFWKATDAHQDAVAAAAAIRVVGVSNQLERDAERRLLWEGYARAAVRRLGPDRIEEAELAYVLGFAAAHRGEYDAALAQFTRALQVREQLLGAGDPLVAEALAGLADVHVGRGRYDEALALRRRGLAIMEAALGAEHPDTAGMQLAVCTALARKADHVGARPVCEQALARLESALGRDHPHVAVALNDLGNIAYHQQRFADAEARYRRALAIRERVFGSEHTEVAETLNNLGLVLREWDRLDEAAAVYRRAMAIVEKNLGPEHPEMDYPLSNLGDVYQELGRYQEALELHRRAMAIGARVMGPDHPDLGFNRLAIGSILGDLRRYREAQAELDAVLGLWTRAYGPDHPNLGHVHAELATLARKRGRGAVAGVHEARARAILSAAGAGQ